MYSLNKSAQGESEMDGGRGEGKTKQVDYGMLRLCWDPRIVNSLLANLH